MIQHDDVGGSVARVVQRSRGAFSLSVNQIWAYGPTAPQVSEWPCLAPTLLITSSLRSSGLVAYIVLRVGDVVYDRPAGRGVIRRTCESN